MKTITIVGWSATARAVVERVTFWPDEMGLHLAIAKAAQVLDLMTVEEVMVESAETDRVELPAGISMEDGDVPDMEGNTIETPLVGDDLDTPDNT